MKHSLLIITCILSLQVAANMASPVYRGTIGASPFVNQYVDVIHEDLFIKIDRNFEYARFNVKYHINSSKEGTSIPLLFYAYEYHEDFNVTIDGKEIEIQPIPEQFKVPDGTKFNDFSYFFEQPSYSEYATVSLPFTSSGGTVLEMRDMLYFETDISEGEHTIEVSYKADKWIDNGDWIKEYSFRYALSPAKYWKSFGTLTIQIDATDFKQSITSNLGKPLTGKIDSIASWQFDKLPIEVAQWSFQAKKTPFVKTLTSIGPFGLALITGILLAILHFIWVYFYRKKHPQKKYSWPVIFGSTFVPLIFVFSWMNYYELIDSIIGEQAGGHHGYTFFVIFLIPIISPIYWVFFWLIDRDFKAKLNVEKPS